MTLSVLQCFLTHSPLCAAAPVPPAQSALLYEREETKLALVMEKQALEEARTARIKVSFERSSLWMV
jgi:hypothetical protein